MIDRALYLRTPVRSREQWLEDNTGKWCRLQDVRKEANPAHAASEGEITIGARQYFKAERVASLLGVSIRTLSRWGKTGAGPPKIKIGKRVLFDVVTLSEWLASRET